MVALFVNYVVYTYVALCPTRSFEDFALLKEQAYFPTSRTMSWKMRSPPIRSGV